MNKKLLGNSDLYLSPIGLGTWAIGGGGQLQYRKRDFAVLPATSHRYDQLRADALRTAHRANDEGASRQLS